jgi:LAO/AO transport system kinase
MLQTKTSQPGDWIPGIILTEATTGRGTEELANAILEHRDFLVTSGELINRRRARARQELLTAIESSLQNRIESLDKGYLDRLVDDLVQRKTNPRSAATKVIDLPDSN